MDRNQDSDIWNVDIKGYEILEHLGQGSMGLVCKARQKSLDRIVALKVLAPAEGERAAFAERFGREARTMARLDHPHIVKVLDAAAVEDSPYLVMECVEGGSLERKLRRRTSDLEEQQLELAVRNSELEMVRDARESMAEGVLSDVQRTIRAIEKALEPLSSEPSAKGAVAEARELASRLVATTEDARDAVRMEEGRLALASEPLQVADVLRIAARRGNAELVVGNVMGSNIANVFLVAGVHDRSGEGDRLAAALAEGRAFLCDHVALDGVATGTH